LQAFEEGEQPGLAPGCFFVLGIVAALKGTRYAGWLPNHVSSGRVGRVIVTRL
jgi:hypothetical protein